MGTLTHTTGHIQRVTGPLVEADAMTGTAMYDLVEPGTAQLPGETPRRRTDREPTPYARRTLERTGTEAEELWAP